MGLGASRVVDMSGPKAQLVKDFISSDSVVIFSKSYCPYCKMAKDVFNKIKQKYAVMELDSREDCDEIQDVLGEMTGARSVPRVFINGKFVGGGSDVKKLYDDGQLESMLS